MIDQSVPPQSYIKLLGVNVSVTLNSFRAQGWVCKSVTIMTVVMVMTIEIEGEVTVCVAYDSCSESLFIY